MAPKSPKLWKWAKKQNNFIHVESSGDAFLDDLRSSVSFHQIWRSWEEGRAIFKGMMGREPPVDPVAILATHTTDELYLLRRDLAGVPSTSVVRQKDADESHALLGVL